MKGMIKSMKRQKSFHCVTKHVGRGVRGCLKRVHKVNEDNKITCTKIGKDEIEEETIKHNRKHFTKAHDNPVHKDKMCNELKRNSVREKILSGRLVEQECDNNNAYEFLRWLAVPNQRRNNTEFKPKSEECCIREVKRSKTRSASSIFSKRTYVVYKCTLQSSRMTTILVTFYNTLFKQACYSERWLNVVETILEKGKGPIIGKLRTLTLIEGDSQMNM